MLLEIGNKQLKDLTAENLRQIIMIEGSCNALEYWNEPEIIRFRNKIFSDTIIIDYISYRKEDNLKSCKYKFFFNFEDFRYHYVKDFENNINHSHRIKLSTLKYLIDQGFNIPPLNN